MMSGRIYSSIQTFGRRLFRHAERSSLSSEDVPNRQSARTMETYALMDPNIFRKFAEKKKYEKYLSANRHKKGRREDDVPPINLNMQEYAIRKCINNMKNTNKISFGGDSTGYFGQMKLQKNPYLDFVAQINRLPIDVAWAEYEKSIRKSKTETEDIVRAKMEKSRRIFDSRGEDICYQHQRRFDDMDFVEIEINRTEKALALATGRTTHGNRINSTGSSKNSQILPVRTPMVRRLSSLSVVSAQSEPREYTKRAQMNANFREYLVKKDKQRY
ncbi:uncharacterized protein LOC119681556 isoform X2 [Teleopsis dalmanni]|nr:uncharacterized protein LOC119681556 isoform X2 [Teleopsis dalmanni]